MSEKTLKTKKKLNPEFPPVLILGGQQNALSIARSLGRRGIWIGISARQSCWASRSRYCRQSFPIPNGADPGEFWKELFLGSNRERFSGNILLACNDDAVEFIALNRKKLEENYKLESNDSELQLFMLDKQKTLELAQKVGCPIPSFWNVKDEKDLHLIKNEIVFPVILKPLYSHVFQRHYEGKKFFLSEDFPELISLFKDTQEKGIPVMICEKIPGPDSLHCSYYTYLDERGIPFFDFTKRSIRRFPINSGAGTYQITEWIPDVAEMGKRFFLGVNFRGFGNIEFKRDLRDGKLKIIEVNPRFTAVQEQILRCGLDTASLVYNHLAGLPLPVFNGYKNFVTQWEPKPDFNAFRSLRRMGEITFMEWIKSIARPQVFPYFSVSDPWPAMARGWKQFRNLVSRGGG